MPVVPFTGREQFEPQRPQMPDEPWALMAAAQMHTEGRLVQQVGMREQGNIDLNNRPMVKNPDGSTSTVRSITVSTDDGAVLLPTVVGGKVVSNADAIAHYRKTGEHLGKFDSEDEANSYAESLHKSQAKQYGLE